MFGQVRRHEHNLFETFTDLMLCILVVFVLMITVIIMSHHQKMLQNFALNQRFDRIESGLRTRAGVLDQAIFPGREVDAAVADLHHLLGDAAANDDDLPRWQTKLQQIRELEARLRALDQTGGVFPTARADLDQLIPLVGSENVAIARWQSKLDRHDALLADLGSLDSPAAIPADVDVKLAELAGMVGTDDQRLQRWHAKLADISELRQQLAVLDRPLPIPQAAPEQLVRLEHLLGPDDPDRQRWRDKIHSIERLHRHLICLNQATPLPENGQAKLEELQQLVGPNDPQLGLWQVKVDRVTVRKNSLRALLDVPQPVDRQVPSLLQELERDVGPNDLDLLRWRAKLARITVLKHNLGLELDRIKPLPAQVQQTLATLRQEVGDQDPDLQRWRERVQTIQRQKAALQILDKPQAPVPVDAPVRLRHLALLVGDEDPDLQRWQEQLHVLVPPAWGHRANRDQHGRWAELQLAECQIRFRHIEAGRFRMGRPDGGPDETLHWVNLTRDFWMSEHEITQAQWQSIRPDDPSNVRGSKLPVHRVLFAEAWDFCRILNQQLIDRYGLEPGLHIRLPTEAEWEYACRAGSRTPLPLLNNAITTEQEAIDLLAWHAGNASAPQAVMSTVPNRWGLYDMLGNVAEWIADGYVPYPDSTVLDPVITDGRLGQTRGGSFINPPAELSVARRSFVPGLGLRRLGHIGLRLVISKEPNVVEPEIEVPME